MRTALVLTTDMVIMTCIWAQSEMACRVLPEWASEIARMWRIGCGHDPAMQIVRPAPDGALLCMAYLSYPDETHPVELLVAYDSLYSMRDEQSCAATRLANAIRTCVETVADGRDFAAVLAVDAGEHVHIYAARHSATPDAPALFKKISGGPIVVAMKEWDMLAG